MKRRWLLAIILLGVIITFLGFVYDVLFAGIPYQDPTPELLANYQYHAQIASLIRWTGLGIFIVGGIAMIIGVFLNYRQDSNE